MTKPLPNRLREFRQARELSLATVAERAGTTHQTVQRLEVGKMKLTLAWLQRLSAAMGYEPADLIGRYRPDHVALLRLIERLDTNETKAAIGAIMGMLGERTRSHAKRVSITNR